MKDLGSFSIACQRSESGFERICLSSCLVNYGPRTWQAKEGGAQESRVGSIKGCYETDQEKKMA